MKTKWVWMAVFLCLSVWTVADSITVPNYSFEQPAAGKIKGWNGEGTPQVNIPNWASAANQPAADSGVEEGWTPTDGTYTGFIRNTDLACYNITDHIIASGESYQLIVDLRSTWTPSPTTYNHKISFLYADKTGTGDLATILGVGSSAIVAVTDAYAAYTLNFSANSIPACLGHKLGVELDNVATGTGGDSWHGMDNVRIERYFSSWISPADGSLTVLPDATLQWAVYKDWNCDVYFSSDPNLPTGAKVVVNQQQTSYDPPGNLQNDTTYYWRVDAYEPNTAEPYIPIKHTGLAWSFKTLPPMPVITDQPDNTLGDLGGTAALALGIASNTTPTYTWYKTTDNANNTPADDIVVATATGGQTNTLTISPLAKSNEGYYFCKVTNQGGTVLSDAVMLGVKRKAAHWTLNEADYVNGLYVDTSGEGHDADPNGTPVFAAGIVGDSVNMIANGFANAGTWNPSQFTSQFTISMWAKWAGQTSPSTWQGLIGKRTVNSAEGMMWQVEVDSNNNNVVYKNGSGDTVTTDTLPTGEWEHLAVVYDGTTTTFYRKGVSAASGTVSPTAGTEAAMSLGATQIDEQGVISVLFNGNLDDIQIYNYALSNTQIGDIFYAVTGEPVCIGDYASEFDFNEDCLVNLSDFAAFAAKWLDCGYYPASECP